ncbi:hypothetical protein [Sneathiella sp.]
MSRNALYFIIGALLVIAIVVGYMFYQEKESGVDIKIGDASVSYNVVG